MMKRISVFFVAAILAGLAVLLFMGSQMPQNTSSAFVEGEFNLANLSSSIEVLHEKANIENVGNAEANFWLGLVYAVGWEVPRDYLLADYYFERAIKKGYIRANAHIGMMYFTGLGRSVDYKKWKYYKKLAQLNGKRIVADPTIQFLMICQPEQAQYKIHCDRLTGTAPTVADEVLDMQSVLETVQ